MEHETSPEREAGEGRQHSFDEVATLVRLSGGRARLPSAVAERLRGTLRAGLELHRRRRQRRRRASLGVAALAASLLLAVILVERRPAGDAAPRGAVVGHLARAAGAVRWVEGAPEGGGSPALRVGDAVATAESGAAFVLAAGGSLRLDAATTVRILGPMEVALDAGALYVDSGGAARDGLLVRTRLAAVREIGTQFEVRLSEASVRVRVREGRVAVEAEDEVVDGAPRDEITLSADGRIDQGRVAVHGAPWSWVVELSPAVRLDGKTVAFFLEWFGRETGLEIRYADRETESAVGSTVIHGPLDVHSPFDALPLVLPAAELDHTLDGDTLWVRMDGAA